VVFLVGETPTGGISEDQFRTAISMIQGVPGSRAQSPTLQEVQVAGPTFSGSVPSLIEAIRQQPSLRFHIVSGSITAQDDISALTGVDPDTGKNLSDDADPVDPEVRKRIISPDVKTIDDRTALTEFVQYLGVHCGRSPELAVVAEDDTDYGKLNSGKSHGSADEGACPTLNFPRGLSRLRAAYQETLGTNAGNGSAQQPLQRLLPLNLSNEPDFEEDHVPVFSKTQTPQEQESEMLQLAATLRWRHIRYAVIVATDPLDTMFVLQFLHANSPETRLAVLGPNLLYLRLLNDLPLEGMLAITYAPLFPATQRWFAPPDKAGCADSIFFRSNLGEGLYNAVVVLLDQIDNADGSEKADKSGKQDAATHTDDDCTSSVSERVRDMDMDSRQPRLWLMMVGHTAYWPVAVFNVKGSGGNPPTPNPTTPQILWSICYYFLSVACILHCLCVFLARTDLGQDHLPKVVFAVARLRHDVADSRGLVVARTAYVLVMTLALLALLVTVVAPAIKLPAKLPWPWITWPFSGLAGVLLIATFWFFLRSLSSPRTAGALAVPGSSPPHNYWTCLALVFVAFVLTPLLAAWWLIPSFHASGDSSDAADQFFYYRSLHLSSGVSPLVPIAILLIALFFWCVTSLRALHQLSYQPEWVPPDLDFKFEASAAKLNQAREGPLGEKEFRVLGSLIAIMVGSVVILLRLPSTFATVEKGYELVCVLAFAASVCLLFGVLARLWYVWRHLHTVLIGLAHLPLRHAFSRLPRDFYVSLAWGHAGKTGNPFESTLAVWSATLECLKRLKFMRETPAPSPTVDVFEGHYDRLMSELERYDPAHAAPRKPIWTSIFDSVKQWRVATNCRLTDASSLRRALADMTSCVRDQFLVAPWRQGISESLDREAEGQLTQKSKEKEFERGKLTFVAEEFMALRYVAYIRSIVVQMRCDLLFISVGYILTVLAMWSYPFQSHHAIGWITAILLITLGAGVLKVLIEMERDGVLSRLSDRPEGKLSLDFYIRAFSYGALPLLTLISAYFPSVSQFLFSWLQPSLQALK
jgi:hypothetical protein